MPGPGPGLARKLAICAAPDGLVLQPLNSKKDQRLPPVRIKYGDASLSTVSRDSVPDLSKPNSSFEVFGIIGLISVFRFSYLLSITRRQQVAQIRGIPVYVVTGVALTPCSSQKDATEAVARTVTQLRSRNNNGDRNRDGGGDGGGDVSATTSGLFSEAEEDEDEEEDLDDSGGGGADPTSDTDWPAGGDEENASQSGRSSIAEDVIGRRGSYGRFAQRWFSRSGWAMGQKRSLGLSAEQASVVVGGDAASGGGSGTGKPKAKNFVVPDDAAATDAATNLFPKFLRCAQILFGSSRSFFFSYDYDITRSLANPRVPDAPLMPLHNHVDPQYFWNQHITQPFVDAGLDFLTLPLMKGFVGQRSFVVDSQPPQVDDDNAKDSVELSDFAFKNGSGSLPSSKPGSPPPPPSPSEKATADTRPTEKRFDVTVISRRSVKRAGLRYLRRGIDDEGYVANSVESEQILAPEDATWDPAARVCSFVQVRGSIPLFFTQTPYSLKPVPELRHSADANFAALRTHLDRLHAKYGALQIVNLVEKHGIEAPIGELFEKTVQRYNDECASNSNNKSNSEAAEEEEEEEDSSNSKKVPFEWFDFHAACRGMKFENVSLLLQTLGPKLERLGSTVVVNEQVVTRQAGVVRTNCMDCLDRTNVCQSFFAKHVLDLQLKQQGFDMSAQADQENAWFNTLWADNGDAVSKQYASTGAMKGDYTRTRKRNYRGALTDAGLSLTRLFNGMFNDFFLQATIDFLLGNVSSLVFEEFETNMMTKDPAVSMQKMREQAIELCHTRIIADESEELAGGWTLLSPHVPDTVRALPFEEVVLLLTDAALYLCRFDWNLDKVASFERVDLAHVEKIRFGTYITATMSPAQTDEIRNVGLVIEYRPGENDITRVNTRSLSTTTSSLQSPFPPRADSSSGSGQDPKAPAPEGTRTTPTRLSGFLSRKPQPVPPRKIALKALHSQTSMAGPSARARARKGGNSSSANNNNNNGSESDAGGRGGGGITLLTEIQQVVIIAAEIERLALRRQPRFAGKKPEEAGLIEKGDVISLAEARRNTGLLEQLGHSIKKMVWA